MRKQSAKIRGDGEKTRKALIEAAGVLAAERGWGNVTAKEVCDKAGVNCASVNYWFGGRDELYQAVLKRISDTIFSQELEIEMVQYETAGDALEYFFTHHIKQSLVERGWPIRVWAREVTANPSDNIMTVARNIGAPRIRVLQQFFADFLGIKDCTDYRVGAAFLTAMSAVLINMLIASQLRNIVIPAFATDSEKMVRLIVRQVMAGLQARRREIALETAQDR